MAEQYKDWAPTAYDRRGLALPDQQDWYVAPMTRTVNGDNHTITESNWQVALAQLEPLGAEVHRFAHWAQAFEIIIVPPTEEAIAALESIESALADYPVLSDDHHSELELNAAWEAWESYGARDFVRQLGEDLDLQDTTIGWLLDHAEPLCPSEYEEYGDGSFNFPDPEFTRDDLAAFIRKQRKQQS